MENEGKILSPAFIIDFAQSRYLISKIFKMKKIYFILTIPLLFVCSQCFSQSGWSFINPQPTNMTLNSIKIFDQNNAIAIGYSGTVMRTSDGGLNWSNPLSTTAATGLDNLHYFDMNFFNENTGLMIGDNAGRIVKNF